ncbi:FixH family protein [Pontixanthobacter gangjinensis]|uniref:Nitrogen fixation protein FixH n=1 Tax=Pontixanthobacter gangjinensis TaxID=1028742 RepID=A0A6I4SI79_9SPHN|nr:FixH family protein [Pontixanthobacter gangjinensis]MXO55359.1 hypothetical protein [Pontixanthobacter gangjinensis]
MTHKRAKAFTGRHAAFILVVFFGIIFAVNFTMASYATSTFGGVTVKNSYVASQEFNGWLDKAEAQRALGWSVETTWLEDGHLAVALNNVPRTAVVTGTARHPVGRLPDQQLSFTATSGGNHQSEQILARERWILRLQIEADGKIWRSEEYIR